MVELENDHLVPFSVITGVETGYKWTVMLLGDRMLAWCQGVTPGEGTNSSTSELCVLHLNNMVGLPPLLGNKGMFLGTYS